MIINPEVVATPDYPVVKIREPRENVNLDEVLPKVLHVQGWDVGTEFRVQFISHDRTTLLAYATFVVTSLNETLQTTEADPRQPITKAVATRQYAQIGNWWEANRVPDPALAGAVLQVEWNPGKKAHEVKKLDGEVVASFTKEDGGKVAAEAFARGDKSGFTEAA